MEERWYKIKTEITP